MADNDSNHDANQIFVYTGDNDNEIHDDIVCVRVEAQVIPEGTFSGLKSLESVQLTTTTRDIGARSFSDCPSLKSVTMVKGNPKLFRVPFYDSDGLIFYDSDIGDDDDDASDDRSTTSDDRDDEDQNCTSLSQLKFIRDEAFMYCYSLVHIMEFPPSLEVIGGNAFYDTEVATIVFAQGSLLRTWETTSFGMGDVAALVSLDLSACTQLDTMPEDLLKYQDKLKCLQLPPNLIRIGKEAFMFCSELKDLRLPASVAEIGRDAFLCCSALTKLSFPPGIKFDKSGCHRFVSFRSWYGMCGCCDALEVVEFASLADFGKSVRHDYFYLKCKKLHSVILPRHAVPLFRWPQWLEMFLSSSTNNIHKLQDTWRKDTLIMYGNISLRTPSLVFSFLTCHIAQYFERIEPTR